VDVAAAASVPVAYGTAHLALRLRAAVTPGQTVLVLGASGGVGTAAVQVRARVCGAQQPLCDHIMILIDQERHSTPHTALRTPRTAP
jgi:D-arabinose 1-dehydrogenase-like Zn-dependent alcohol dehydrogenase